MDLGVLLLTSLHKEEIGSGTFRGFTEGIGIMQVSNRAGVIFRSKAGEKCVGKRIEMSGGQRPR